MKKHKIIAVVLLSIFSSNFIFATSGDSDIQANITNLENTIKKNKEAIIKIENENESLYNQIVELKKKLNPNIIQKNSSSITSSGNTTIISNSGAKASSVEKYNILIDKINSTSAQIFSDNNVSSGSSIGLFEFIEPSNFFISIDDGLNPAGVTAFKKKILYSYDKNYNLKIDGIFDLDYKTQYYITKFGKNPFAKATRIRVKNPSYKGKLLEEVQNNNTTTSTSQNNSSSTTTTSNNSNSSSTTIQNTSTTTKSEVTVDMIKKAYNANKILDALKYSNEYILKDPNNLDVLKIRYRSLYLLGKFSDSLVEVAKIINITGEDKVEKIVVCDAKTIAKLAKNTDLNQKYAALCSSK